MNSYISSLVHNIETIALNVKRCYCAFMKPLYHPSVNDMTVEGILYALCDPVRAKILADIARAECPQSCSVFLNVQNLDIPKSTLSKHFTILREAGLIRSVRKGVELQNSSRCAEIKEHFGSMVTEILKGYEMQLKK
jgi:DNA-binding transcriptional ArsR family regulator